MVLLVLLASFASVGAAHAADLVVLGPDSATVAGAVNVDHLYIGDGATLNLAGDTFITANDVYIAGGARLSTCNGCIAGRTLTISSPGQINIGAGIDLTAGAGTFRPGGSLALTGASVAVSGGIDTSGSMGAPSGFVSITSTGAISVSSPFYMASVDAPGAAVSIHGTSVSLTGGIDTSGSDAAIVNGGPVELGASTGGVTVGGDIDANGRDGSGGAGSSVILRGANVRVGSIDTSAGSNGAGPPGVPGPVDVAGTASIAVGGAIDARGANGPAGFASSNGSSVHLVSGGPIVTGAISAQGADATGAAASNGGPVALSGGGVATGQIDTYGGSRNQAYGYGGQGNNVTVTSTGAVTLGDVEAFGGASAGDGLAGASGGNIAISGQGVILSELRTTPGNSNGIAPGGSAGAISVTGSTFVSLNGGAYATGGNASGAANQPPMPGGNGGPLVLHAAGGALSLAGPVRTGGGNGGNGLPAWKAGSGGAGGPIDLVGTPIDPIVGISSEGGDGGFSNANDLRGNGGPGGAIHAWSETNPYGGLRSVSTAGGSGAPPGLDGAQLLDSGPAALAIDPATGLLGFTSKSPSADGYNVFESVGGAAATLLLTTKTSTKIAVPAPALCIPVTFSVTAFKTSVGWTSPAAGPVPYLRQPSATQKCTDAPALAHGTKPVVLKAAALAKRKGAFSFVVTSNGLGAITATATAKGAKKPIGTATLTPKQAGSVKIALTIDRSKLRYATVKKRTVARFTVKLVAAAPTGAAKSSKTVSVEVRK